MKNILKKIKEYDTIIIHGHQRPDGDCLGSQFGLKNIIQTTFPSKHVYAVGSNASYVSFLGKTDIIEDEVYNGALVILVDTANTERADDQRYKLGDYIIKIDHHVNVEDYGNYQYVDDKSPACAQIITEFYDKFKNLKMTKEGAIALYTGIITDTGGFKYDNVLAKTHNLTAILIDLGVVPSEISTLLSVETFETLKLKGYVLANFKVSKHGFAYIEMTRDIIEKYHVSDEQAAALVNTIGSLDKCPVWALIIEYEDAQIKIRLRSKGPVINTFAEKYNGGGHPKASGASLDSWYDLPKFIEDIDNLVKEYKESL